MYVKLRNPPEPPEFTLRKLYASDGSGSQIGWTVANRDGQLVDENGESGPNRAVAFFLAANYTCPCGQPGCPTPVLIAGVEAKAFIERLLGR